jgi:hypothetical protein
MRWRKMTWVLVIWTALCVLWVGSGMAAVADDVAGSNAAAVGAGIGVTFILFFWFLVFVPLAIVWFATRPKDTVVIYGPQGQQMTVSEKEARKRVEKMGWTYQRS